MLRLSRLLVLGLVETSSPLNGDDNGKPRRTAQLLSIEKRVPYLKVGHFVRFDPSEIAAWLDHSRVTTSRTAQYRSVAEG